MEWNEMKQTNIAWQLNGLLSNRNHGRTQHENRYKDKNHNSYVRFSFIIKSTKKTHTQTVFYGNGKERDTIISMHNIQIYSKNPKFLCLYWKQYCILKFIIIQIKLRLIVGY